MRVLYGSLQRADIYSVLTLSPRLYTAVVKLYLLLHLGYFFRVNFVADCVV